MWIIAAFDLPVSDISERREYRKFRKLLLQFGFMPFQRSLFFRWIKSGKRVKRVLSAIRKQAPAAGDILFLPLPDPVFQRMLHIQDGHLLLLPGLPDEWQIF